MKEELTLTEKLSRWLAVMKAKGLLSQVDCDFILGDMSMAEWMETVDDKLHVGGTE